MREVYEAANTLEAHMLAGYLAQLGIAAHVAGEHLQSAAGEIPVAGLARLQVADEDYERAREAIAEWERAQPAPESEPVSGGRRRTSWGAVILAFLAGVLLAWVVLGKTVSRFVDYNQDGLPEEEHFYRQDVLERSEYDRNHDEQPDEIYYFDARGLLDRVRSDDDFNGFFEGETRFSLGQPIAWTLDHDQNGVIDGRGSVPTPAVDYFEILDEASGRVVRRTKNCLGLSIAELIDSDRDGRFDTAEIHDPRGGLAQRVAASESVMNLECPPRTP
jgi:hypothetical protein